MNSFKPGISDELRGVLIIAIILVLTIVVSFVFLSCNEVDAKTQTTVVNPVTVINGTDTVTVDGVGLIQLFTADSIYNVPTDGTVKIYSQYGKYIVNLFPDTTKQTTVFDSLFVQMTKQFILLSNQLNEFKLKQNALSWYGSMNLWNIRELNKTINGHFH